MTRKMIAVTTLATLLVLPVRAAAQQTPQRFVLVAGATFGGTDRPVLRYVGSDAERFCHVLVNLLVYYSGHADDKAIQPADDRYSCQSLRDGLDDIPATGQDGPDQSAFESRLISTAGWERLAAGREADGYEVRVD